MANAETDRLEAKKKVKSKQLVPGLKSSSFFFEIEN